MSQLVPVAAAGLSGTPEYTAPEQWEERSATTATDIYAATVTFYECLTGFRPFRAETNIELLVQHVVVVLAPSGDLQPTVPDPDLQPEDHDVFAALDGLVADRHRRCCRSGNPTSSGRSPTPDRATTDRLRCTGAVRSSPPRCHIM